MKKEKIILFLIVILVALIVAGVGFYIYESTKTIPSTKIKKVAVLVPTPTPKPSIFISVSSPSNEQVFDKKIITVSGKTIANSTVFALSPVDEESGLSTADGDFSMTLNIDDDQNVIEVTSIAPNGETATKTLVVTYSTESF